MTDETPPERRWMADAVVELQRLTDIIEGRHEARLQPPHGQSSARPRALLERYERMTAAPPEPPLDVERIGRAIHAAKKVGGPWGPPCGYPASDGSWIEVGYNQPGDTEFDCECEAMASHLVSLAGGAAPPNGGPITSPDSERATKPPRRLEGAA